MGRPVKMHSDANNKRVRLISPHISTFFGDNWSLFLISFSTFAQQGTLTTMETRMQITCTMKSEHAEKASVNGTGIEAGKEISYIFVR